MSVRGPVIRRPGVLEGRGCCWRGLRAFGRLHDEQRDDDGEEQPGERPRQPLLVGFGTRFGSLVEFVHWLTPDPATGSELPLFGFRRRRQTVRIVVPRIVDPIADRRQGHPSRRVRLEKLFYLRGLRRR